MIKFNYNFTFNKSNTCYVCSNSSMNLDFHNYISENRNIVVSYINLGRKYSSYDNVIHGGIVATILDEAHSKLAMLIDKNYIGVTMELNVNYLNPVKPNCDYLLISEIVLKKEKIYKSIAYILKDGNIIAKSNAVFRIFKQENEKFKDNHLIINKIEDIKTLLYINNML